MTTSFFPRYTDAIRKFTTTTIAREVERPMKLLLASDTAGRSGKRLEVAYAPFDFVNERARIVILGLTPGGQQMQLSLEEASRCLCRGLDVATTLQRAKTHASFGGSMRAKLIELLDFIGVNKFIDRQTTAALWSKDRDIVHFTSCLRYPVFVDGKNYSGQPPILKTRILRSELERWLVEEMQALPSAVWIALGDHAADAARYAARLADLNSGHLITGLPHPSGANNERIAYFLGQKSRDALSSKTNAAKIDLARDRISAQMAKLVANAGTDSRMPAAARQA